MRLLVKTSLGLLATVLLSLALPAQNLTVSPTLVNFSGTPGSNIPSQGLQVNSTGASQSWSVLLPINYSGGASGWLTYTPNGTTPGVLTLGVNTAGIAAGNYSASFSLIGSGTSPVITANLCIGTTQACTPATSVSPTSLTFTGTQASPPAGQVLTISSTIPSTGWTATPSTTNGINWLVVTPASGDTTASPTANVTVNLGLLPATTAVYSGMVTITTSGGSLQVPVNLSVGSITPGSVSLSVSNTSFDFYGIPNPGPANQQLIISDTGSGGLGWTSSISSSSPWLHLATASGVTPFNNAISIDTTSLGAGSYNGTITISAPAASNPAVTVNVSVVLAANNSQQIVLKNIAGAQLSSILFILTAGNSSSSQTMNVNDTLVGSVNWGAAPQTDTGGAWLSVTPRTGATPANASVTVNPSGLAAGTYTGSVAVTAVGVAPSSSATVPVTMILNSAPGLTASPTSLSFSGATGDTLPSQVLNIASSVSSSVFNWNATVAINSPLGGNWLSLSSTSGATPGSVNVMADTTGLLVGTYSASITFAAANSPSVVVPVTLTISSLPSLTVSSTSYTFAGAVGSTISPQSLQIGATLNNLMWSAALSVQTPPNGFWLQVSATFGTTPSSININPVVTGLGPGTYTGKIVLSALGSANTQVINVTLTLTPTATLAASPATLTFAGSSGSAIASQTLTISNSNPSTGTLNWTATASVTTPSGGAWLSLTPASGTTTGIATVTASAAGLPPGTYSGTIQVTSTSATNTVSIPVTLTVTNPVLAVGSSTLTFNGTAGGVITSQGLTITSTGGPLSALNWTAATATQSGGTWLSILPTSGTTPSNAVVSVASASLAPGSYTGTIVVSDSSGGPSQTVTVTLNVSALAIIGLAPQSLQFIATRPVLAPQSATFDVQNLGVGAMSFIAVASTSSGGNWLTVTPGTGSTPSTLTATVNAQGLAAGSYVGAILITPAGSVTAVNASQTLIVTLSVDTPVIYNGGIVNGASFASESVASPGELMSLFGGNLATVTTAASGLPLPTTLSNTQVLVNGNPVPLFFVSSGQINFVFPETAGNSAVVTVVANGTRSLNAQLNVTSAAPGIFTAGGGQGLGMVLNPDYTANSPARPVSAGQAVQIFATGLGVTSPRQTPGQPGNSATPFNNTVVVPKVTIGGIDAVVTFSAAAPGLAGVYQVNAVVPAGLPTGGFVVMTISSNGKTSNPVVLSVK